MTKQKLIDEIESASWEPTGSSAKVDIQDVFEAIEKRIPEGAVVLSKEHCDEAIKIIKELCLMLDLQLPMGTIDALTHGVNND